MVTLRNILLLITIFIGCSVPLPKQNNNYKRICEYFELDIMLSQDTIVLGDETYITVIFKNKTDTSFYFYPEALLCIDRYVPPNTFIAGEYWSVYYLSKYANIDNLTLLKPHENYYKTYNVQLVKPLLVLENNRLCVKYMCSNKIQKHEQKREHDILYGSLQSFAFEIYVKER